MKFILIAFFAFTTAFGVAQPTPDKIIVTTGKNKTTVRTNEKDELLVNVSNKDIRKWKARGVVHYRDFGAKGDGKADDINAIAATHAFANEFGLPVKADDKATYYIGGKKRRDRKSVV